MDSLPGAGAEILNDDVKAEISPLKIKSHEWLRIMEEAHELDIKSSATMMYGTVETEEQRARHIMKIAELQEKKLEVLWHLSLGVLSPTKLGYRQMAL